MSRHASLLTALSVLALSGFIVRPVAAQDEESSDESADSESKGGDESSDEEAPKKKEKAKASDEETAPPDSGESSLTEEPGRTYYFVGARYRAIIVPKFMINLFGEGGRTVVVHAGGPEFGIRKDGFEYNLGLWFANYAMAETPFKAPSDPATSWEIVHSEIKVLYLTADFLWSHEFSPAVALNYGLGAGFGIVWGNLYRVQSYPGQGDDVDDPYTWNKCRSASDGTGDYCSNPDNNHYRRNGVDYTEPSWANGGSKPVLFPWLALQTGLRVKVHRHAAGRFDVGFGTSGFFLGVGLDYGI